MKKLAILSLLILAGCSSVDLNKDLSNYCPIILVEPKGEVSVNESTIFVGDIKDSNLYHFNVLFLLDLTAKSYEERLRDLQFELGLLLNKPEYSAIKNDPFYQMVLNAKGGVVAKTIIDSFFKAAFLNLYMDRIKKEDSPFYKFYKNCEYSKEQDIYHYIQIFTNSEKRFLFNAIKFKLDVSHVANIN